MEFEAILTEAHQAARNAQAGMQEGRGLDCGFAWVTISGVSPLARYCRKRNMDGRFYGFKGYPTGWKWWKPGGYPGQSIGIHEAGAMAFRDVLAKHGYSAEVGSRYD